MGSLLSKSKRRVTGTRTVSNVPTASATLVQSAVPTSLPLPSTSTASACVINDRNNEIAEQLPNSIAQLDIVAVPTPSVSSFNKSINQPTTTSPTTESVILSPLIQPSSSDIDHIHSLLLLSLPNDWCIPLISIIIDYFIPSRRYVIAISSGKNPFGYITSHIPLKSTTQTKETSGTQPAQAGAGRTGETGGNGLIGWQSLSCSSFPLRRIIAVGNINERVYFIGGGGPAVMPMTISCHINHLIALTALTSSSSSSKSSRVNHNKIHDNIELRAATIEWSKHAGIPHQLDQFRSIVWNNRLVLYREMGLGASLSLMCWFDSLTNAWVNMSTPKRYVRTATHPPDQPILFIYHHHLMCYSRHRRHNDTNYEYPIDIYDDVTNTWNPFIDIKWPSIETNCLSNCITINKSSSSSSLFLSSSIANEQLILIWDNYTHYQVYDAVNNISNMTEWLVRKLNGKFPEQREMTLIDNEWLIVYQPDQMIPPYSPWYFVHLNDVTRPGTWQWFRSPAHMARDHYHVITV
jgi:hypothetical protein